jgi:hypothetical protein
MVGEGENQTVLTAHQTLLQESPLLMKLLENLKAPGPVSRSSIKFGRELTMFFFFFCQ